jgi:hypothetical protein
VILTKFDPIYLRAKQVRDMIGHSLNVSGPVHSAGKQPVVAVASAVKDRSRVPDPLLPSTFTRLTADCEWLNHTSGVPVTQPNPDVRRHDIEAD